ncbi:DUF547 domain-containing protein [Methylicorpusculum sp.]|uniref:DUF547 domain-containing protein n=1 Tax=Methylicorpusculum sp. TaxID=2713644 RepID=UPI002AB815AE|nr:DUF547 domain-containing protein [Methylicorpusculum sp.]MDZ4152146.1 DUF547 domain-containing protein [Methylicorpusculum sp.]
MFNSQSVCKFIALSVSLLVFAGNALAEEPDWSDYRAVLAHVKPGTKNGVKLALVDYPGIKANGSLDKTYQTVSAFDPKLLHGRDEQLAFYINAYNILALKTVADHWPVDSIKDVGSLFSPVWDKPAGELGGKTVSLGEVEHKILRPMGEPRIHLAIVCASVSCPDLRDEPYTAAKLSAQLDEQAKRFLENTGKGLIVDKDKIRVSQIFDWFEQDFAAGGGVDAFIKHYRPDLPDLKFKTNIDYDWSVNGSR